MKFVTSMLLLGVSRSNTPFRASMVTGNVRFWHWRATAEVARHASEVKVVTSRVILDVNRVKNCVIEARQKKAYVNP